MMKRIVSPDAGWDEDFGDLPEWLQDWGTTEAENGYWKSILFNIIDMI